MDTTPRWDFTNTAGELSPKNTMLLPTASVYTFNAFNPDTTSLRTHRDVIRDDRTCAWLAPTL